MNNNVIQNIGQTPIIQMNQNLKDSCLKLLRAKEKKQAYVNCVIKEFSSNWRVRAIIKD